MMEHGTVRRVGSLRLKVVASTGLGRVLVAHGAVFVDGNKRPRLAAKADGWGRSRVGNGGNKVLARKVAAGRGEDVVVDVILAKLRGGASRIVVRLDARLSWSRQAGRVLVTFLLGAGSGAGAGVGADFGRARFFLLAVVQGVAGVSIGGRGPARPGLVQLTLAVAVAAVATLEEILFGGAANSNMPQGLAGILKVILHLGGPR